MYSCNQAKRESVVLLKSTAFKGFESASKCRFDMRYDPMHQQLGCKSCAKEWDVPYLIKQGLIK